MIQNIQLCASYVITHFEGCRCMFSRNQTRLGATEEVNYVYWAIVHLPLTSDFPNRRGLAEECNAIWRSAGRGRPIYCSAVFHPLCWYPVQKHPALWIGLSIHHWETLRRHWLILPILESTVLNFHSIQFQYVQGLWRSIEIDAAPLLALSIKTIFNYTTAVCQNSIGGHS